MIPNTPCRTALVDTSIRDIDITESNCPKWYLFQKKKIKL